MARQGFGSREAIGVLSIAAPRQRLIMDAMQALAPALLTATAELGPISNASSLIGPTVAVRAYSNVQTSQLLGVGLRFVQMRRSEFHC